MSRTAHSVALKTCVGNRVSVPDLSSNIELRSTIGSNGVAFRYWSAEAHVIEVNVIAAKDVVVQHELKLIPDVKFKRLVLGPHDSATLENCSQSVIVGRVDERDLEKVRVSDMVTVKVDAFAEVYSCYELACFGVVWTPPKRGCHCGVELAAKPVDVAQHMFRLQGTLVLDVAIRVYIMDVQAHALACWRGTKDP